MTLRILCDCDGVLSDFVGTVLEYIRRNTGMSVRREAIDQWDCFAAVGLSEHWPFFRTQCDELDLCKRMPELPGARELWAEIRRIDPAACVCTTPMTVAWLSQRAEWLVGFGVNLKDQIHVHSKAELARDAWHGPGYDVLVDDKAENCEAFERAGGRAFCIAAPYNTHVRTCRRGTHAECIAWLREIAAGVGAKP